MPKRLVRCIFRSFMVLLALCVMTVAGVAAGFYLTSYLPAETYYEAENSRWSTLNVRLMAVKSPEDFRRVERGLYLRLRNKENISDPKLYYLLGSYFEAIGDDKKAQETYDAMLTVAKRDPLTELASRYFIEDAQASKSLIYYRAGQYQKAQEALSSIPEISTLNEGPLWQALSDVLEAPSRSDFHFELARQCRSRLDLPMARQELQLALKHSHNPSLQVNIKNFLSAKMPGRTQSLTPMGRYFALAGSQLEEKSESATNSKEQMKLRRNAIHYYERVLSDNPDFEWGYQQIAHLYQEEKSLGKARQYAERALAYNPNLYLSRLSLGDIALAQGDYAEAEKQFSQARTILCDLNDNYHQVLLVNVENQLGFTQELLQQSQRALFHYQQAVTVADNAGDINPEDVAYAKEGMKRAKQMLWQKQQRDKKVLLSQF